MQERQAPLDGLVGLDRQILELFDQIKIQDPAVRDWFIDVLKTKRHDDGQASLERRQELQRQLTPAMNQQQRLVDLRLERFHSTSGAFCGA